MWACWSCDFLNCWAMPLGADLGGGLVVAAGGGIIPVLWASWVGL
jgi:hypothetical protein